MPTLKIDLREGFDGDTVLVRVGGREVYRRSGVRTNYSIGLADRVETEVGPGPVEVRVELPERGTAGGYATRPEEGTVVAVALDSGRRPVIRQVAETPYL
ncbi:MAG TPA: hypothetical protein VF092_00375 [Longimicrobium sp.]